MSTQKPLQPLLGKCQTPLTHQLDLIHFMHLSISHQTLELSGQLLQPKLQSNYLLSSTDSAAVVTLLTSVWKVAASTLANSHNIGDCSYCCNHYVMLIVCHFVMHWHMLGDSAG